MRRSALVKWSLVGVILLAPGFYVAGLVAAPVLSPVLPRPAIVSPGAKAYWDWKGFGGLAWEWCSSTPDGRVQWAAFAKGDKIRVSLTPAKPCPPGVLSTYDDPADVNWWTDDDELIFRSKLKQTTWSGAGLACGFTASEDQMRTYIALAREAQQRAEGERQVQVLSALVAKLRATNGNALTSGTSSGDYCTNGPRWRS